MERSFDQKERYPYQDEEPHDSWNSDLFRLRMKRKNDHLQKQLNQSNFFLQHLSDIMHNFIRNPDTNIDQAMDLLGQYQIFQQTLDHKLMETEQNMQNMVKDQEIKNIQISKEITKIEKTIDKLMQIKIESTIDINNKSNYIFQNTLEIQDKLDSLSFKSIFEKLVSNQQNNQNNQVVKQKQYYKNDDIIQRWGSNENKKEKLQNDLKVLLKDHQFDVGVCQGFITNFVSNIMPDFDQQQNLEMRAELNQLEELIFSLKERMNALQQLIEIQVFNQEAEFDKIKLAVDETQFNILNLKKSLDVQNPYAKQFVLFRESYKNKFSEFEKHLSQASEILQQSKLAQEMIKDQLQDIKDYRSLENGDQFLTSDYFDLSNAVIKSFEKVLPKANRNNIKLMAESSRIYQMKLINNVMGDEQRLMNILQDVMNHALQFTQEGGSLRILIDVKNHTKNNRFKYDDHIKNSDFQTKEGLKDVICIGDERCLNLKISIINSSTGSPDEGLPKTLCPENLKMMTNFKILEQMGGKLEIKSELGLGTAYIIDLAVQSKVILENSPTQIDHHEVSFGQFSEQYLFVIPQFLAHVPNSFVFMFKSNDEYKITTQSKNYFEEINKKKFNSENVSRSRQTKTKTFEPKPIRQGSLGFKGHTRLSGVKQKEVLDSSSDSFSSYHTKKRQNCLLVNQYPQQLFIMTTILKSADLDVDYATNGFQAFQKVQNSLQGNPSDFYNLILMDLDLPIINGIDACQKIHKLYTMNEVPYTTEHMSSQMPLHDLRPIFIAWAHINVDSFYISKAIKKAGFDFIMEFPITKNHVETLIIPALQSREQELINNVQIENQKMFKVQNLRFKNLNEDYLDSLSQYDTQKLIKIQLQDAEKYIEQRVKYYEEKMNYDKEAVEKHTLNKNAYLAIKTGKLNSETSRPKIPQVIQQLKSCYHHDLF